MNEASATRRIAFFTLVGHAVTHMFLMLFPPLLKPLGADLRMDTVGVTFYYTVVNVFFGLGAAPAGWLAGRLGDKPLLVAFFVGRRNASGDGAQRFRQGDPIELVSPHAVPIFHVATPVVGCPEVEEQTESSRAKVGGNLSRIEAQRPGFSYPLKCSKQPLRTLEPNRAVQKSSMNIRENDPASACSDA